jgi:hypothetical protein
MPFRTRLLYLATLAMTAQAAAAPTPVTVDNFVRAETDMYFGKAVKDGGFGKLVHDRELTPIEKQAVVRMNRDTLYSSGVFDLDAGPLTVTLPPAGKRFVSMQVISQDHYTTDVVYSPGAHTYDRDKIGTRYVFIVVRMFLDPRDPKDIAATHQLQDAIRTEQPRKGTFAVPEWDSVSQAKARQALEALGSLGGAPNKFGTREEVGPVDHLIGAAAGWGGNPTHAAVYIGVHPQQNDGTTVHVLEVKDVPVDGFWSISVYNDKGFFQKNPLDAYSLNNLTAGRGANGAYRIQFGACRKGIANCLPISNGWNYTVRLYRPKQEILDGSWHFPEARPGG